VSGDRIGELPPAIRRGKDHPGHDSRYPFTMQHAEQNRRAEEGKPGELPEAYMFEIGVSELPELLVLELFVGCKNLGGL